MIFNGADGEMHGIVGTHRDSMLARIMAGRRHYSRVALFDFDKTIMKYPSIQRFPGGASNDLIPNLQHPENPVPLSIQTICQRRSLPSKTGILRWAARKGRPSRSKWADPTGKAWLNRRTAMTFSSGQKNTQSRRAHLRVISAPIPPSEKTSKRLGFPRHAANPALRADEASEIHLGTSGFTACSWSGSFYPEHVNPPDFLRFYATKFDTVEIGSTFHRLPKVETLNSWALNTPLGFVFALKAPRAITHTKILQDCHEEFERFLNAADILGEKLGPVLLEFPHFDHSVFSRSAQFMSRLSAFLDKLPRRGYKFAIEIRNRDWLTPLLADQFREYNLALVLQDQSWMPRPEVLLEQFDPVTADFVYIRWQGDHKGIEERTKVWNKTIFDRTAELRTWVDFCRNTQRRGIRQYIYVNNYYAGHAPATLELFQSLFHEKGIIVPLGWAAESRRSGPDKC